MLQGITGRHHAEKRRRSRTPAALTAVAIVAAVVASAVTWGPSEATAAPRAAVASPTVATSSGSLQGSTDGAVDRFLGIRYAKAPVGALRFAPAVAADSTGIALAATTAGRRCVQTAGASSSVESEDCLFLNVTRPTGATGPLPVVVYWHGGGFKVGNGVLYDPTRMVTRGGVVVVTVNYRLGDLGYLALPGLGGGGNFGFSDQLESLRWVRRNIAAFGGDARNVTVAGESAGALSVCAALTSPAAAGLFDKAILSSGQCATLWAAGAFGRGSARETPFVPRATAEQQGVTRATALGCSGSTRLACLRAKPAATFTKATGSVVYPVAHGTALLPRHPAVVLRDGGMNRVPVLSGSNHDETRQSIAVSHQAKAYTAAEYDSILRADFGGNANRVAQAYPSSRYTSPGTAWSTVATDASWACPTLWADRMTSASAPTYAYEFGDPAAPTPFSLPGFPLGAYHAVDLHYLFDLGAILGPAQVELANTMVGYWTSFARSGDPNGDGRPPMPRFQGDGPVTSLAPGSNDVKPTAFATDHQCGLWSTVPF